MLNLVQLVIIEYSKNYSNFHIDKVQVSYLEINLIWEFNID